ncbi:MAG: DUF2085 domain-containing protein, partial [Anaerolineaceae bacterium]|nr:DUF2085 domain-containing protein [Anaerolineaceae bacterium]
SKQDLSVALGAAMDRRTHLEEIGDKRFQKRIDRGRSISGADRFSLWLSNHYMAPINLILFIYIGLALLAPVLMKFNLTKPAKVIYAVYSPLCHQFGFRSVFLFGEQFYYPRSLANIDGLLTYEEITSEDEVDVIGARSFLGDESVGYKTALCQRDLAIYAAMLIFGVIFSIFRRRISIFPWYFWILAGIVPIGIDGFSQLPGLVSGLLPAWLPFRESTPFLRFLTGGLFGLTTAWYLYPMIEETMKDTRRMLLRKVDIVSQLDNTKEGDANAISQ